MTRAEMLQRMSAMELAHWVAFYRREAREREQARIESERKARLRSMGIHI